MNAVRKTQQKAKKTVETRLGEINDDAHVPRILTNIPNESPNYGVWKKQRIKRGSGVRRVRRRVWGFIERATL